MKTDGTVLEKADREVAATVIHQKSLLRVGNWLRSPLLQLPTEIIIHILSYTMGNTGDSSLWLPVINTCRRVRDIMCTSAALWWRVDFSDRLVQLGFERSRGNLEVLIANLLPEDDEGNERVFDTWRFCRNNLVLRGRGLHTIEFCGYPSHLTELYWIFERPLPRLEHLKIEFAPPWEELLGPYMEDPVVLQLPTDLRLRVLDLSGAILPWSSSLFAELSELHLDFSQCDGFVEISEEDMLRVFEASPQLESLSLYRLLPNLDPVRRYTPARVVQFASLKFLVLDSFPMLVGYILHHMDIPVIERLKIRMDIHPEQVEDSLDYIFDNHLPSRLFQNPPKFDAWPDSGYGIYKALKVNVGNCQIQFDFEFDDVETPSAIMTRILPSIPSPVTSLRLDYSRLSMGGGWLDFFLSHPEVRSIEFLGDNPAEESLWNALSPVEMDGLTLCPNLESIALSGGTASAPLFDCLLERKAAGFGLKYLRAWAMDDLTTRIFKLLVDELHIIGVPTGLMRTVRLALVKSSGTVY